MSTKGHIPHKLFVVVFTVRQFTIRSRHAFITKLFRLETIYNQGLQLPRVNLTSHHPLPQLGDLIHPLINLIQQPTIRKLNTSLPHPLLLVRNVQRNRGGLEHPTALRNILKNVLVSGGEPINIPVHGLQERLQTGGIIIHPLSSRNASRIPTYLLSGIIICHACHVVGNDCSASHGASENTKAPLVQAGTPSGRGATTMLANETTTEKITVTNHRTAPEPASHSIGGIAA